MSYLEDQDLEFLQFLKNQELQELYNVLVYDKDGDKRLTETLSTSDEVTNYGENYSKYWQRIAEEFQCLGANSFATLFRNGIGVPYKQILCDVCDKLRTNYNESATTESIELNLIQCVLKKTFDNMNQIERSTIAQSMHLDDAEQIDEVKLTDIFVCILKNRDLNAYKFILLIVNAVLKILIGRKMDIWKSDLVDRPMALLDTAINWTINQLCMTKDIVGLAYRVTIPAVFVVIGLRQHHVNRCLTCS